MDNESVAREAVRLHVWSGFSDADDVFQETFLQVHQSIEQFDPTRRFRPWLFTIAANKARDLIRSQARRPTNPLQASISPGDDESGEFIDLMQSAAEMPSEPMERRELQQLVHNTVTSMPEPRTSHYISNVEILVQGGGVCELRFNWVTFSYRYKTVDTYFGTSVYTLDTTAGQPLIKRKKVILKNDCIHHVVDIYHL